MKKSTLIMILSLVLAVALGVGGTLAYLTDEDGDINVMTVGYVTITQNEQERVEIGNADKGIDQFTQNKPMNPAVFVDYSSKEDVDANGWDVQIRDQVKNYVDKIVSVTNTGANDAYVRTIYATPEAGDFSSDINSGASDQWLHWNGVSDTDTTEPNGWIWGKDQTTEWPGIGGWDFYNDIEIVIDGEARKYDIFVVTNRDVLKPGETTAPSMVGLYLDPRVDCEVDPTTGEKNYTFVSEDGTKYNLGDISNLKILALSQAVQADGFDTAWDAFDAAFPTTQESLASWLSNIEPGTPGDKNDTNNPPIFPVYVTNADELKAALADAKKGDVIVLAEGDYGHVAIDGTLEDVVIQAEDGAVVFFDITSSAKLNDVTIEDLNGTYPAENSAAFVDGGVVNIDAGAEVTGLVIDGADLSLSGGRSSLIGCSEPSADITIKDSNITGSKYLVYASAPVAELTVEGNTISNISSWMVLGNAGDAVGAKLTVTGNTMNNCTGGIAKYLGSSQPDGAATVFTDNTLTSCTGHDGADSKWFAIPGDASTVTVSGNTLDDATFAPGTSQGLGK